jgi:uncharacterized protein (TIGR00369 family)
MSELPVQPLDAPPAESRRRSFAWHDPVAAARAGRALSGLDYLRAILAGTVPPPPIMATLGLGLAELEAGCAVFTCAPQEFHYNPFASVHGGLAATMIDSATACAALSLCPVGQSMTTLELKVSFVRPITVESGALRCEGRIVHAGRRVATAEARLLDGAARLCAHGSATCLFFPPAE